MPFGPSFPRDMLPRFVPGLPQGGLPGKRPGFLRDPGKPFERHLLPDTEGICPPTPADRLRDLLGRKLDPFRPGGVIPVFGPQFNSVALFFNLVETRRPGDYRATTADDARNWLDEGADPATPTISTFMEEYWRTLSYGNLVFQMNTPRDEGGTPLVPVLDKAADDWGGLITAYLDLHAEAVWRAAGGHTKDGKRVIPSIVLVQHYWTHASANFGGFDRVVNGATYAIGDITHIGYGLDFVTGVRTSSERCRGFWGTLCHEFSHNFLEFWDLYGPQGCTGYWDLLGDNSPPGVMSEVSSYHKNRIGWLEWKQVIQGPSFARATLSLAPYTTTGEAIKVVPDPAHNPHEFFVLEYRKSTGPEPWRPDGGLTQEGLLITHFNTRLGVSDTWLVREAPYFDPEFADASDHGAALWTGWDRLNGILFPQPGRDAFTATTAPSSNFYGDRPSGLSITGIRLEDGVVRFELAIDGRADVGWTVSAADRAVVGRFSPESASATATEGQEIFLRNDSAVALVIPRQAQFFVAGGNTTAVGSWTLGPADKEIAGDFDGDGQDEIFVQRDGAAAVLKWDRGAFRTVTAATGRIGGWALGAGDRSLAADLDGDGVREIYTRSAGWAGVFKLGRNLLVRPGRARYFLQALSVQGGRIGDWALGPDNHELVGRFTQRDHDEILIRSPGWIGLFDWDAGAGALRARAVMGPRVDGWALGGADHEAVGDFDGDGLDEIYIRSPGWAGVIKWQNDRFQLLWIRQGDLAYRSDASARLTLAGGDQSYGGRFLPDRAGVLHRGADRLAILTWEGGEMKVRSERLQIYNAWQVAPTDHLVLGDFHRIGMDAGDPTVDFVTDRLTDMFLHNGWGTGMIGVNHLSNDSDQIGLTWINQGEILRRG